MKAEALETIKFLSAMQPIVEDETVPGWLYTGPLDLLLRQGMSFTPPAFGAALPLGTCYTVAISVAMADPAMVYCEGYALLSGTPIPHAWCCTEYGEVIETFLKTPATEYYGIALRTEYVRKVAMRQGDPESSALDDWTDLWPLVRGVENISQVVRELKYK